VLWLGVKTSGKINGVDPETVRLLMTQLNETVFTRPIDFQFESFQVDMKRVVAISVVESTHKPIELITNNQQKTAYFRVDGQVLEATKIVLNVWKLQAINALNSLQAEFDEQLFQRVRNEQPVTLSQLYRFFSNDLSTVDKSLSFLIAKKRLDFTLIKEQLCYKVME
jgi:predicted HTH transcriptional regulator